VSSRQCAEWQLLTNAEDSIRHNILGLFVLRLLALLVPFGG
jgi:hypothetical protein